MRARIRAQRRHLQGMISACGRAHDLDRSLAAGPDAERFRALMHEHREAAGDAEAAFAATDQDLRFAVDRVEQAGGSRDQGRIDGRAVAVLQAEAGALDRKSVV